MSVQIKRAVAEAPASYVANALREAISRGELAAGAPLRQDKIAEEYGVSHIPIREALKQLTAEGFCDFHQNRGFSVSSLSANVAWELTEYRSLLEGQMIRWAVPNLRAYDLDCAGNLLNEIDASSSVSRTLDLSRDFHNRLYTVANRPFFFASIQSVRANLVRYWRLAWQSSAYKSQSQMEHWHLLELCRDGKAQEASDFVDTHIKKAGELIVQYIESSQTKSTVRSK